MHEALTVGHAQGVGDSRVFKKRSAYLVADLPLEDPVLKPQLHAAISFAGFKDEAVVVVHVQDELEGGTGGFGNRIPERHFLSTL